MSEQEWMEKRGRRWVAVVAENIRAAREAAGLTQAQVGERSGILVPVLSRLESGRQKHLPSLSTFLKVAEAIGVEPAELLREKKRRGGN